MRPRFWGVPPALVSDRQSFAAIGPVIRDVHRDEPARREWRFGRTQMQSERVRSVVAWTSSPCFLGLIDRVRVQRGATRDGIPCYWPIASRLCLAIGLTRTQRKCHSVMTLVTALTVDNSMIGQPFAAPIVIENTIVDRSFHKKN